MTRPLSKFTREENVRTINRLKRVMARYGLKKSEVAYLLGYTGGAGRQRIHKWFTHCRRCPSHVPDTIRAIMDIRDRDDVMRELKEAKRTKRE